MSLNLHDIVRNTITVNLADQPFSVIRSIGKTVINSVSVESYKRIDGFYGNFQSEGDAALNFANLSAQNSIIRRLYLYASSDKSTRAWTIYRPLARSGDYILDKDGNYWQVSAVIEDFSDAGWECVRITFQQTLPKLNIVEDDEDSEE